MHGLIGIATILIVPFTIYGADYVVAPTGSDSAAGTVSAPWLTLQHAANVVGAGDQVTVRAGSYAGFYLNTSGTATAPIEFLAQPGTTITQPNSITPDGINLEGASYVTIDGFAVTGMPRAGVRSVGVTTDELARFVTIRDVDASNNGTWGIFTGFVDDLLIENNIASGSQAQHGIYVSNSGDRPVIRNNIVFGNHDAGIHMNGDISQGGDGIISNAVISGNIIYNNGVGGGSGINMDGVQNSRIENNLLYDNHASGISLFQEDGGGPSTGNIVVNNTIDEASDSRWALNIQGSTGNSVLNNILLNEHPTHGAINITPDSLSGLVSDYNVVISRFTTDDANTILSLQQWQSQTGEDLHSLVASASDLFVNAAGGDYHLRAGAAAIDAGTSQLAPTIDIEGKPRPIGSRVDIGAYELGAAASVPGDYNNDGMVDAADYVVWRSSVGQSVTPSTGADGDGNGVIGSGDYSVWRANFGTMRVAASVTVPEPDAWQLWFTSLYLTAGSLATCRSRLFSRLERYAT